jgi:predicted dehydrogenase
MQAAWISMGTELSIFEDWSERGLSKLRVGVIGTGMAFERLHYPAYLKLSDVYEIGAVCDQDESKLADWGQRLGLGGENLYTDWRKMVGRDDLDVIDIMVPIELNYAITEGVARELAGKRKGIICEKPLAGTFREALSARELAQRYSVMIMIAENYRYSEEMNIIRDLVTSRRVGDPMYFIYNRTVDFPSDVWKDDFAAREWRQYPQFPGGAIADMAVHDIAGMRHVFGAIDRLHAFGRPQEAEFSPYSVVAVNLLFKSGLVGQFSFFCAGKEMQRPLVGFRIFGTEGMIYLEERNVGVINVAYNDRRSEQIPYDSQKGYYNELLNLANALTGKEPVSVPPEMEYGDLKMVRDILKSVQEQKIVTVDKTADYVPDYTQPGQERPWLQ